jgi:hypothetical protein
MWSWAHYVESRKLVVFRVSLICAHWGMFNKSWQYITTSHRWVQYVLLSLRYGLHMYLVIAQRLLEVWASVRSVYMDKCQIARARSVTKSEVRYTSSAQVYSQLRTILRYNIMHFINAQE